MLLGPFQLHVYFKRAPQPPAVSSKARTLQSWLFAGLCISFPCMQFYCLVTTQWKLSTAKYRCCQLTGQQPGAAACCCLACPTHQSRQGVPSCALGAVCCCSNPPWRAWTGAALAAAFLKGGVRQTTAPQQQAHSLCRLAPAAAGWQYKQQCSHSHCPTPVRAAAMALDTALPARAAQVTGSKVQRPPA